MAINKGDYVIVQDGDTLSEIAEDYLGGASKYKQLAAINGISNPDLIYPNQKIYLSEAAKEAASSGKSDPVSVAKITAFGEQSNNKGTLFAEWSWSKSNTENYKIKWEYFTGDTNNWYVGTESTTTYKYSTYSIPSNAKQVRFKVLPVSKKKGDSDSEVYWTSQWVTSSKFSVTEVPDAPSIPSAEQIGTDLVLYAELNNLSKYSNNIIQFQVSKDSIEDWYKIKVAVTASSASFKKTVDAGGRYRVRCRALVNGVYSDWSDYTSYLDTVPSTPSKLIKCETTITNDETGEKGIYLEWSAISSATKYQVQYSTNESYLDNSSKAPTPVDIGDGTNYTLVGSEFSGKVWYVRIRAVNSKGESGWSEVSSTSVGTLPTSPTTWSSITTAAFGEDNIVTLYWVHNSEDGSTETSAEIELTVNEEVQIPYVTVDKDTTTSTTSSFDLTVSDFSVDTVIKWRVRTAGATKQYGDWSTQRVITIYEKPSVTLSLRDYKNEIIDDLDSPLTKLPVKISTTTSPVTQTPIGFHLSIIANEDYETVDDYGNSKVVLNGDEVYSEYFNTYEQLTDLEISAGDVTFQNGVEYIVSCTASMNSGLTAVGEASFRVDWVEDAYEPSANITVDKDNYTATIQPHCSTYSVTYYKVTKLYNVYTKTSTVIKNIFQESEESATTETGEQVYYGTTASGDSTYYCQVVNESNISGVLLSVYRRESDGTFTELAKNLESAKQTAITDPHPSLDYARYRIVAKTESTGAVSYYDIPAYPVMCSSAIIQWDEAWSSFDTYGNENEPVTPTWTGSLLELKYNINITDSNSPDVSLVKYIGRENPVSYYGTIIGRAQTWNTEIPKTDKETLYALRRLSRWMGDVYVRDPTGNGYWANVKVSYNVNHCEVTIPVSIEITKVEGGK